MEDIVGDKYLNKRNDDEVEDGEIMYSHVQDQEKHKKSEVEVTHKNAIKAEDVNQNSIVKKELEHRLTSTGGGIEMPTFRIRWVPSNQLDVACFGF